MVLQQYIGDSIKEERNRKWNTLLQLLDWKLKSLSVDDNQWVSCSQDFINVGKWSNNSILE